MVVTAEMKANVLLELLLQAVKDKYSIDLLAVEYKEVGILRFNLSGVDIVSNKQFNFDVEPALWTCDTIANILLNLEGTLNHMRRTKLRKPTKDCHLMGTGVTS